MCWRLMTMFYCCQQQMSNVSVLWPKRGHIPSLSWEKWGRIWSHDFFSLSSSSCSMTPLGGSTDSDNFKSGERWEKSVGKLCRQATRSLETAQAHADLSSGKRCCITILVPEHRLPLSLTIYSVGDFPCWVAFLCPPSVPDQLSTPPLRMPACHHVFSTKQVRYCVIKSFTHVLQVIDTDKNRRLTYETLGMTFFPTFSLDILIKHFGLCFQSSEMCVYISFINRRELLLNPLDFLPRAVPCPSLLFSTALKQPPKPHSEHCSLDQAR